MPRALSILLSPLTHDSRVLRQVAALSRQGHETYVFALHEKDLPAREKHPTYRLVSTRLLFTKRSFKFGLSEVMNYAEAALRLVVAGAWLKPDLIHANDLKALPIGYAVAKLTGARLVYDSHELWSDPGYVNSKRFPGWAFRLAVQLERYLSSRADAVITVSDGIARCMADTLGIPTPLVVRNVPPRHYWKPNSSCVSLHEALRLSSTIPIVLHLGSVSPERVLPLIESMRDVPPPTVLVFLGKVEDPAPLKSKAQECGVTERIYFHPPVASSEICNYAKSAALGVSVLETKCLNFKYALPNKLFEYLQAGLPVVVNDSSERADLVRAYEVGETFPDSDPRALARAIMTILNDTGKREHYQKQAFRAAKELNWEREESRLLEVYQRVARARCAWVSG
jgi:glycosyltransferase involved in cell wall biosynthesis